MKRPVRLLVGAVTAAALACFLAVVIAAPRSKDLPPGVPMSAEQIRATLQDNGSITYADGTWRLSAAKVDGPDLADLELRKTVDGRVVYSLTSPQARIVAVDAGTGTMRLYFDRMKVVRGDEEIDAVHQELDFPAPRQGNRP
ncbi:MAG TPA: hypothetical protein VKD72_21610 [Gemmataceae bacterium]|nr:hypothetical protein [Gemmataceae bacterium]